MIFLNKMISFIKAEWYCFLKRRNLNKFRRFLIDRGDHTKYTNKAILFGMAQQIGHVKKIKWNDVPWLSYFYIVQNLSEYQKKYHDDFWNGKDVLIVEGLDLSKES